MNTSGARLLITDQAQGRVWEADPNLPLERYEDRHGSFLAPAQEAVFEDMRSTVAPVQRRTPRERFEATLRPIIEQALAAYKATGKIVWPRSAEDALVEVARLTNDPSLLVNTGGVEQVIKQGTAIARWLTETGEMKQKALDYKKVTLDWSGH